MFHAIVGFKLPVKCVNPILNVVTNNLGLLVAQSSVLKAIQGKSQYIHVLTQVYEA